MNNSIRSSNTGLSGSGRNKSSSDTGTAADSFWKGNWQWFAIGILSAVALVLGYIGFRENAAALGQTRAPLDLFYLTLQLFTLESGSISGPVSWELEAARLLAPVVPVWTVFTAAVFIFRDRVRRYFLRWIHGHIVILGLSRLGLELAREARSIGRRVAVVANDSNGDLIHAAERAGCSVIKGDIADGEILSRVRADRAYATIAVTDQDGVNIASAVSLHYFVQRKLMRGTGGVTCFIQVSNPELCSLLQNSRLGCVSTRRLEFRFFNFYQDSARLLLEEHPLDRESIGPEDRRTVHLIIIGLGQMGQSLALEAAKIGHFANGRPLRVTMIDREVSSRRRVFLGHHPQFEQVCDAHFIEGDAEEYGTSQQIRRWTDDADSLTTVAICLDGDSSAFSAALAISMQIDSPSQPIWVRLSNEKGLASQESEEKEVGIWKKPVCYFGQLNRVCSLDKLLRNDRDSLAIAIHENYMRSRSQEGGTAEDPSMQPWDLLDESLKNSNRQQADHMSIKLRAIGCQKVPVDRPGIRFTEFTESEIEIMARMEHARWTAARVLGGWIYGPKDVAVKASPYLVPWEDLPENIREYDREAVRKIPHLLSLIQYRIERCADNSF